MRDAEKLTGFEIVEELERQVRLKEKKRPLVGVVTNNTAGIQFTGGVEFVPARLESLVKNLGPDGIEVKSIDADFSLMQNDKPVYRFRAQYEPETQENLERRSIRHIIKYF